MPNSYTSPELMRPHARKTVSGDMRLPEPRSSPAPHFDGQRALSGGGCHDCAIVGGAEPIKAARHIEELSSFDNILPVLRSAEARHCYDLFVWIESAFESPFIEREDELD